MSGGTLFLVVGPSGGGKDTLLAGAEAALRDDPRYLFVRRYITRPADAGGEPHYPVTPDELAAISAAGRLALTWQAHDLGYGIPIEISDALAAGRHVVANVSRAVIDNARRRFPSVVTVLVTASPATLRQRLIARDRETAADIERRIARAAAHGELGGDVRPVANDGTVEEGVIRMVEALKG